MATIDERVVRMKFDNKQFQQGINTTISLLDRFKSKMNFGKSRQSVDELKGSFDGFTTNPMIAEIQRISPAMAAMSHAAGNVLTGLLRKVANVGKNIYDQTIGQVVSGGLTRAMNIEQAEFMLEGLGMDVDAAMNSANEAVLGTAYGLDQAAKAAAQFGASGMEAGDDMTSALRGIAGVAAMTSSEYDDIANIFTTVSGNGRLMSEQLNQIASRGINAAAALGEEFGKTEEEIREMTSAGEISFEMFYQAMDGAFGEHATKANETYTGSLSNLRAALGRIGADVQAQKLESLRDVFNALTPVINDVRTGLEPLVAVINEFMRGSASNLVGFLEGINLNGFRISMIHIAQALRNVRDFLSPIGGLVSEAFGNVFPTNLMTNLVNFTRGLQNLTEGLSISGENADRLRRTFEGVFAIFSIVGQIISGVVGVFLDLVGATSAGAGGFLEITATIGDFLSWVDRTLKEGELLTGFFKVLGAVIRTPIQAIGMFIELLGSLFGVTGEAIGGVEGAGTAISNFGERVREAFGAVRDFLQPGIEFIKSAFTGLMDGLRDLFSGFNFETLVQGLFAGGLAALAINIRNFTKRAGGLKDIFKDLLGLDLGPGGLVDSIKDTFGALTDTLGLMQTEIKADILIKIAIAVGILTASVVALSLIDAGKLTQALVAIGVMMTELGAALAVLGKIKVEDQAKVVALAASMILLATALLLMSAAVRSFATLDWNELAKGLVGISVSLGLLVAATNLMPDEKRMFRLSVGLIALSAALLVMAQAVKSMSSLSWEEMARGLLGTAASLGLLVAATKLMEPQGMIRAGVGLLAISTALVILSSAVRSMASLGWGDMARGLLGTAGALGVIIGAMKLIEPKGMIKAGIGLAALGGGLQVIAAAMQSMSTMSWEEIGKGLVGIAGSLLLIAGAMHIMPKNLASLGAGLILVASGVKILAEALGQMGDMSWDQLGAAFVGLGGSLLILSTGLSAMSGTLGGSAALFVAALALRAIAPVLIMLGNTPWQVIVGGLLALAGVFTVLGVATAVLAPLAVPMIAIAGAMLLMSTAAMVAGTALAVFAAALGMLAGPAAAGVEVLADMLTLIPDALGKFAEGVIVMFAKIAENIGELVESLIVIFSEVFMAIIETLTTMVPEIAELIVTLVSEILDGIIEVLPKVLEILSTLFEEMFSTIEEYTPRIIELGKTIMLGLLQAIQEIAPEVGATFLVIVDTILSTLESALPMIVTRGVGMIVSLIEGIESQLPLVISAATNLVITFASEITAQVPILIDAGYKIVIDLINGIAEAIRANSGQLGEAGANLGLAIIEGMISSITSGITRVGNAIRDLAGSAVNAAKNALGINSPSRVFMKVGDDVVDGMVKGIDANADKSSDAAGRMAQGVTDSARDALDINSPSGVFQEVGENVNEGMAKGIDDTSDKPVEALEGTLDSMIDATDTKTRSLEASTGSFYDTLLRQFNNNPTSRRLQQLSDHAKAAHATAVKERKIADEEEIYQAEEERRRIYENVEEARKAVQEAKGNRKEAESEARDAEVENQRNADDEAKHAREVEEEKKKITDAERKLRDAERERDIYEYRMHGEEAGVAFVDGVAVGLMEEKEAIPTVAEILSDLLMEEFNDMRDKVDDAFNIFDKAIDVRDSAKTISDHLRDLDRALKRMSNSTNEKSFGRNLDSAIDSIFAIGSELIDLMEIVEVFEPYLPMLFNLFDDNLDKIIPLVAKFSPELANTLGGGLAAALPQIAGPAAAIVGTIAAIWLVLKDSAENQYILNFLEMIVNGIEPFLASLPGKISGFIQTMVKGFTNILERLPEIIVALIHGLVGGVVEFIRNLPEVLPVLVDGIITAVIAIIKALPELIISISTALAEAFLEAVPLLIELIIFDLPPLLLKLAFALITGLVEALGAAVDGLLDLLVFPFQLIMTTIEGFLQGFDFLTSGRDLIGDLLGGIIEGIDSLLKAIAKPIRSIYDFIESLLPWNIFDTLGIDMMDGLLGGIIKGIDKIIKNITKPLDGIVGTVKNFFGIRSPSKLFAEIGRFLMEGLGEGAHEGEKEAEKEIEKVLSNLMRDLDDGPDGTITITPVVDLTKARKDLSSIGGFVDSPTITPQGMLDTLHSLNELQESLGRVTDSSDKPADVTNIYYTQNNTSPEPLRAIDIYRNTQRQLDLMR